MYGILVFVIAALKKEIKGLIDQLSSPSKRNTLPAAADKEESKPMDIETSAPKTFENYLNTQRSQPEEQPPAAAPNTDDYYRQKIPYNTSDPEIISQQESILHLLISHGICNDETFKVFIAEPDSNKGRASEILDSLYCVGELIPSTYENVAPNEAAAPEPFSEPVAATSSTTDASGEKCARKRQNI